MNRTISDSEPFVRRVMHALPQRESLPRRVSRRLMAFIMSPWWMWLCLVLVVGIFHRPLLYILSAMGQMTVGSFLLTTLTLLTSVILVTYQMLRSV